MDALASDDVLLFDDFRLDRRGGGLFRRDEHGAFAPVAIGSRALDVLGVMTERAGDLVSRDEIIAAVWPATVVEDNNLNMQIAALRRILDDRRTAISCIQTVPGRGYRFVAAVTRSEPETPSAPVPNSSTRSNGTIADAAHRRGTGLSYEPLGTLMPSSRAPRRTWRGVVAAFTCAVVLVTAVAVWNWHSLWFEAAHPAPRLSIVVLPFANLSDDPEEQYFTDGVTEDLTADLSRISGSFVISRNTAFTYKGKPVNAKQIGSDLGVRYVLEGSVQRSGKQVRVNAQLIDAEIDSHLWAERFDRDIGDLFALQNEITGRIAVALNFALVDAEAARPTANPDALDYLFRGRAVMSKPPTRDNFTEAINLFERALALDHQSVAAQSWLALALTSRVLDGMSNTAAADIARAKALVGQALAAAPRSGFAHGANGNLLRAQNQCEEAIPEYEAVIALNRNSPAAYASLAQCKFYTGSIEEAVPLVEQAIRLSPRDPQICFWYLQIGRAHLLQSRIEEAIVWLEKARSANPAHPPTHAFLASAYALNGETGRAATELAEARKFSGDDRYSSIARLLAVRYAGMPRVRAVFETTYFAGLRKAGMPEE
jgi:TolB-like protein/DNA-binding winged helix-turn-helix (wHTH) protein/cytochrome c-type biogenesis protein CcmH/NrfG